MIKLLEDLLIKATTNPNVPGDLVTGLRKAVDTVRCGSVKGKTFAFTGVLPTLSRDEARVRIEEAGGVIVSAVSAKLDYLVAGSEAGSKLLKALELGVPVIGEKQLQAMLPAVADLLPPPFDSLEEAQRAAGMWPQEAEPPYRVCIKAHETDAGNTVPVGHVVALESGESLRQPDCWVPCDKDGWVSATIGSGGLKVEFRGSRDEGANPTDWRPAQPPQVSAIDEMAEQMRRWAAPTRDVPDIEVAHFICITPVDGYAVGDRIRAARDTNPTPDPQVWAPCDADGWVHGFITWPVGLKVVKDGIPGPYGACRWRPMVQQPAVVTEGSPGPAVETREDFDKAINGLSEAMGVPKRRLVGQAHDECAAPGYTATVPTGIDATLAERGSRYGKFEDHSEVSQALKKVVFTKRPRETLAADQVEALEMICHKIGRIANGDPDYADSWVDIAGYAKLVADRLKGVSR